MFPRNKNAWKNYGGKTNISLILPLKLVLKFLAENHSRSNKCNNYRKLGRIANVLTIVAEGVVDHPAQSGNCVPLITLHCTCNAFTHTSSDNW